MKRSVLCIWILAAVVWSAFPENTGEKPVSYADVMKSLEEINQRLDMGIGTRMSFTAGMSVGIEPMVLLEVQKLNDYLASQGSFPSMNMIFLPFVNGFTWHLDFQSPEIMPFAIEGNIDLWDQESKGFLHHSMNPLYPDSVTDKDGDGLVDYYSNIEYSMFEFDLGASYRFDVVKDAFAVTPALKAGIGKDDVRVSEWQYGSDSVFFRGPTWSKTFFSAGGSLAVSIFGLEIGGSFEYHIDLTGWEPATGVGKSSAPPAADFNSMNFTVWLNPVGLFEKLAAKK